MIDDSPLQLEHILGYAGDFRNTCLTIPSLGDGKYFVKGMGSLVVIENLLDPHDQKLLRGHDSQISAIAVSPSGSYIASGQVGTEKYRGRAAPIFIWDTITGRRLTNLRGLTTRVNAISFSLDERFVCACGEVSYKTNIFLMHSFIYPRSPPTHIQILIPTSATSGLLRICLEFTNFRDNNLPASTITTHDTKMGLPTTRPTLHIIRVSDGHR